MAKKTTTNKKTEKITTSIETDIISDIEKNIPSEITEIIENAEEIKPTDELVNSVMNAEPEVAQEMIENELNKIDNLKNKVEEKLNEVISNNPGVQNVLKKNNAAFTYIWNGMNFE
jgi:hypothetical protein